VREQVLELELVLELVLERVQQPAPELVQVQELVLGQGLVPE